MYTLVALSALLVAVSGNDLLIGKDGGRKIYDEKIQASPAIWKQVQNVTVNVTDSEIIGRVVVTDLRPNKDGEATVLEGGEGQKTVTLELKSPTVFRGFEFQVEVFAVPDNNAPSMNADTDVNQGAKQNTDETVVKNTDVTDKVVPPAAVGDQARPNRETDTKTTDPVVKYLNDKDLTTEKPHPVSEIVNDGDLKVTKTVSDKTEATTASTAGGSSTTVHSTLPPSEWQRQTQKLYEDIKKQGEEK